MEKLLSLQVSITIRNIITLCMTGQNYMTQLGLGTKGGSRDVTKLWWMSQTSNIDHKSYYKYFYVHIYMYMNKTMLMLIV